MRHRWLRHGRDYFYRTYKDRLAYNLLTVCYGATKAELPNISIDDVYTKKECEQMLADALPRYKRPLERCIDVELTQHQWAALVSAAYNAGSGAVCRSPMVRKFNQENPEGACNSFVGWYETSAHVWRKGLHNRRMDERGFAEHQIRKHRMVRANIEDEDIDFPEQRIAMRPIPDPTVLTTAALVREISNLKEIFMPNLKRLIRLRWRQKN